MELFLLHGANLNLLGIRESNVYGFETLDDIVNSVTEYAGTFDAATVITALQTNSEAELIDAVQKVFTAARNGQNVGIIINPGAFTHYSYALRDALAMLKSENVPVIEVHISNPHSRELFRHQSAISEVVTGTIAGLGSAGYILAAKYLLENASVIGESK